MPVGQTNRRDIATTLGPIVRPDSPEPTFLSNSAILIIALAFRR